MDEVLNLDEEEKLKTSMLLWLWWHNRNKANAGDTIKSNDEILFSVKHQLANETFFLKQ
jgi:hypothetical protein